MAGRTSDFMPLAAILVGAGAAFGLTSLYAHAGSSAMVDHGVVVVDHEGVDRDVIRHAIIVDRVEHARRVITVTGPDGVTRIRINRPLRVNRRQREEVERLRENAREMTFEARRKVEEMRENIERLELHELESAVEGLAGLEELKALKELDALERLEALSVLEALDGLEGELLFLGVDGTPGLEVQVQSGDGDEQHRRKRRRRRRPGG